MASSLGAIKKQIQRDAYSSAVETRNDMREVFDDELIGYFVSPEQYVNTGTLIDASNVTPVSGGGDSYEFKIEMDGSRISYSTGTPLTGEEVVAGTEDGLGTYGHGQTVGHHGYYKRTETQIPDKIDKNFSKRFKKV